MRVGVDEQVSGYFYRDPQCRQAHIDAVYDYCQAHLVPFTALVRLKTESPANRYALLSPERIGFSERFELIEKETALVCEKLGHKDLAVIDLEAPPERALIEVGSDGRLSRSAAPIPAFS